MSECYPTGCTPCTSPIEFPENPSDEYYNPAGNVDLTETPASQNLEADKTYKVTNGSETQSYLDTNYPGLTHPVEAEKRIKQNSATKEWKLVNPTRHCVFTGPEGTQKCWVYDKCIPGWRAEGPNTSPAAVYRGGIDIKTEGPGANIEAGHFYIQTKTVTKPYYNPLSKPTSEWGSEVDAIDTVVQNSRIAFNGQEWEVIPGPEVPYASDALGDVTLNANGKPVDDTRIGGIVKTATLSQAKAGTDKCDTITPYTLNAVVQPIKDDLDDLKDDLPDNIATTDDILWEINADDKLTPKDASNEVLVTPRIIGGTTVSVVQRIRIGDDTLPVVNPDDPAANDASVSIVQGTVRCWQAGEAVPAGEQRYCVFDENGYIIPGGNPADTDFGTGSPGQEITINVSGSAGTVNANNGGGAQTRVKDLPSYRFTRGGSFTFNGISTFTYNVGGCSWNSQGSPSVSYSVEIRKKDDGQVLARGTAGASGQTWTQYCNGGTFSGNISQLIDPGTSVEAEVWLVASLSGGNNNVRGTHTFFFSSVQIDITT